MKFLLDTNAVIAILNKKADFIAKLKQYRPSDFGIPAIVLFELYYGAEKSQRTAENTANIERLPFEIVPFSAIDAKLCGKIRTTLERAGTPIGAYDVQIAAQAQSRNLTLITHNVKEFQRVNDLNIQDWEI
nr:type II toxin-antitoxin system VapC family toxin [uncultured Haemophilus sp.]